MDIQAVIGIVELSRYEETLIRRREIMEYYAKRLSEQHWAIIPDIENAEKTSSFHLFLLRIKGASEAQRDEIMQKIFENQVSVNVHFQPLPMLTAYKKRGYKAEDYPETFNKYRNEISLPVYFNLSDSDIEQVVNAVIDAVNEVL
jgi:dTDP-4-amino-4,6-dideoxygalactose transaminase